MLHGEAEKKDSPKGYNLFYDAFMKNALLCFLLLLPALSEARAFKCVDPAGHVTYDTSPCADNAVQVSNMGLDEVKRDSASIAPLLARKLTLTRASNGVFKGSACWYAMNITQKF
ncbi:MAG: DUF4124 domain-containing protein [Nitrosomonadales bacterium]|nr:DUF4124 domain-containing protein [Nitrosomonadales bacterium]